MKRIKEHFSLYSDFYLPLLAGLLIGVAIGLMIAPVIIYLTGG